MTAHSNTMQFLRYLKEYSKSAKPVLFEGKLTGNKETRKRIEFNYKSPFDAILTIIHNLKKAEEVCGNAYYNGYMSRPTDNVCFFSIAINTNKSYIYIDCEMRKDKLTIFM